MSVSNWTWIFVTCLHWRQSRSELMKTCLFFVYWKILKMWQWMAALSRGGKKVDEYGFFPKCLETVLRFPPINLRRWITKITLYVYFLKWKVSTLLSLTMFWLNRKEIFGSSQSVSSYFHSSGEMASILQDPIPGLSGRNQSQSSHWSRTSKVLEERHMHDINRSDGDKHVTYVLYYV